MARFTLATGSVADRIVPLLLGLVGGAAVQLQQGRLWPVFAYGVLLAVAMLALWWLSRLAGARQTRHWLSTAALAAVLGFALTGWRASAFLDTRLAPALEGRDLLVTGVVAAMPQMNEAGSRFRLRVEQASLEGQMVALPPLVYLGWYSAGIAWSGNGGAPDLQRQPSTLVAGERWQMLVRLKAPHGNRNPHGFDYELWLWEQGLQATGYVRAGARDMAPRMLGQTGRHPVERLRQQVRDRIFERVGERRQAGLIAALVVGDQNAIDRSDWDVFRATGVAHLMSISGLHVTMFAWFAAALVGHGWRRSARLCRWLPAPHAAVLGGLLLATAYAVFSGWGVPSQRTIWMLLAVGFLRLSARHWPWPVVWSLACAVVVAVDPWALTQAGFWLSFVAVAVLFASGPPQAPQAGVGAALRNMLREQWVVTVALAPLSVLLFGQLSLVGLVANMVAIPWVTLVVTPLAMAGALFAPLWDLAAAATSLLAWYLDGLLRLPLVTLSLPQASLWAGVGAVAGGVLLVMRLPWAVRGAGIPMLVPALLWPVSRPAIGEFELLAADIGQGNAVLVRTANHALLYDAGPRFSRESDAGHRVLVPLLRALDVRLDVLMLSHRDTDHVGGAAAVLAMQSGAGLFSSIGDDHELAALRPLQRCVQGQRWQWDGVDFQVLHPQAQDYQVANRPNALSCVLRVASQAGDGRPSRVALLAGDIERAQELRLVAQAAPLQADLLLVPHHGSKTSSSAELLDQVAPQLALVQAGYRNRFGHPAAEVVARYQARGIGLFDSPRCGAFTWQSSRPGIVQCYRVEAHRYWNHSPP